MTLDLGDIDFVYFDLDDTLLDHRGAQDGAIARLVARYPAVFDGTSPQQAARVYAEVNLRVWRSYVMGDVAKSDLGAVRFGEWLDALGVESLSGSEAARAYMDAYLSGGWRMLRGALPAFRRIARARPVGIITNGLLEVQQSKLAFYPILANLSHDVIISEAFGVMKPHRGLFDIAARRAGVPADRILHIGDSLESDVRGALRAGWRAVWYGAADPGEEPRALNIERWPEKSA